MLYGILYGFITILEAQKPTPACNWAGRLLWPPAQWSQRAPSGLKYREDSFLAGKRCPSLNTGCRTVGNRRSAAHPPAHLHDRLAEPKNSRRVGGQCWKGGNNRLISCRFFFLNKKVRFCFTFNKTILDSHWWCIFQQQDEDIVQIYKT